MTSETYLDVPGTENAGRRLSQAVEEFKGSLRSLNYELERDHGCWSDDEIGKQFESSYLDEANQTRESLRKLRDSLTEFADVGLPNVISNVQELDSSYGDVMKQYRSQVEEYRSKMTGHMLPPDDEESS
ncbi:Sec-independent protein translocase protein TatA [Actinopolyspora lacussalsi]|nr:Sec-independent protein translocase protein TatA [Actinopolyspora lacussalsi]